MPMRACDAVDARTVSWLGSAAGPAFATPAAFRGGLFLVHKLSGYSLHGPKAGELELGSRALKATLRAADDEGLRI